MPSVSPAQHRWIGWLHSNPAEAHKVGMSPAKVDEWLHSDKGSPWKHRDDGGGISLTTPSGVGGMSPSSTGASPMAGGLYQQYASMPTEKLQEMNARLGGTPYGQIIRQVLQKRLSQPNAGQTAQIPSTQSMGMQTARSGGMIHRAMGGGSALGVPMSMADPWWTKQEAYGASKGGSGFLAGSTSGRADQIKTTAPGGAYVLPADVVAGLGDGNSLAGARVMDEMLSTGPHGTPMARGVRGRGPPRPPSDPSLARMAGVAKGGGVHSGKGETPVALSHGEYILNPDQVVAIGGGDHKRGTRILDHFVMGVRKRHIDKLKKLPPPVGAKL